MAVAFCPCLAEQPTHIRALAARIAGKLPDLTFVDVHVEEYDANYQINVRRKGRHASDTLDTDTKFDTLIKRLKKDLHYATP